MMNQNSAKIFLTLFVSILLLVVVLPAYAQQPMVVQPQIRVDGLTTTLEADSCKVFLNYKVKTLRKASGVPYDPVAEIKVSLDGVLLKAFNPNNINRQYLTLYDITPGDHTFKIEAYSQNGAYAELLHDFNCIKISFSVAKACDVLGRIQLFVDVRSGESALIKRIKVMDTRAGKTTKRYGNNSVNSPTFTNTVTLYSLSAGDHVLTLDVLTVDGSRATVKIDAACPKQVAYYPPVANEDIVYASSGVPVTFSVLDNDYSSSIDPLVITSIVPPFYGKAVLNDDGTITYTANNNFPGNTTSAGRDTLRYTINDGNGGTATGKVKIFVYQTLGSLKITNHVDWNGVPVNSSQKFTVCITGPAHPDDSCRSFGPNTDSFVWTNLLPGTYLINASYPGKEWSVDASHRQIVVPNLGQVEADLFNTRKLADLKVVHQVNWNGSEPDPEQTFEICIWGPSYTDGNCQLAGYTDDEIFWEDLVPGTYSIQQTNPGALWVVTQPVNSVVMPTAGETVILYFGSFRLKEGTKNEETKNEETEESEETEDTKVGVLPGGLHVTKVVDWNGVTPDYSRTFDICITGESYPEGSCKLVDYNGGSAMWQNLLPGDYLVHENGLGDEWDVEEPVIMAKVLPGVTAEAKMAIKHHIICDSKTFNPKADLVGKLPSRSHGVITNNSKVCTYVVGMASYQRYDDIIENQTLYDFDAPREVPPGKSIDLYVTWNQSCAVQIDLFYGDLVQDFATQGLYGKRLLANRVSTNLPFCQREGEETIQDLVLQNEEDAPAADSDGDGVIDTLDCAPYDPTIYPGAPEIADDGIDQDCDGVDWVTIVESQPEEEAETP